MRIRHVLSSLLAAAALLLPTTSASAADAYAFTVVLQFDCLGCDGVHPATMAGSVTGTVNGAAVVAGGITGSLSASTGPTLPVTCAATVSATGSVSGALSGSITITWTPPAGLIVATSAHGSVWVGTAVATSINCLGVTFVQAVGTGQGVSF
jgi:hypothetical protein